MNRGGLMRTLAAFMVMGLFLSGCGEAEPQIPENPRATRTTVLTPEPPGEVVFGNDFVSFDASRTWEGYFQICYSGSSVKAKLQLTNPDGTLYTYTLRPGGFETLPLTGGSGTYELTVLENAFDNIYAMVYSDSMTVEEVDEFKPYLYPNQYVWFTQNSPVCALGVELSGYSRDDLDYVEKVYSYVVENISYDDALAASMPVEYLPELERTMETKQGICLDYASLMTALLRSQGIPTKVVVGYSGQQYHAWISVYLEQTGWMDGVIYFDGTNWSRIDPTLAAGNIGNTVKDYVNNNSNYREKYFY